jgi:hypothetical protein
MDWYGNEKACGEVKLKETSAAGLNGDGGVLGGTPE